MPTRFQRFSQNAFFRAWDVLTQPQNFYSELAKTPDLKPGFAALLVTSLLFAASSLTAHVLNIPFTEPPLWPHPAYRIFQALALPLIFFMGCLLGSGLVWVFGRALGRHFRLRSLLAVLLPTLLVPLWPMLWPTDLAVSLGLLNQTYPGFPGFWVRELAPTLTVIYILFLLTLGLWQTQKILWREAFALGVVSFFPTLGFWALILR
jgi:hypothetical protein